VVLDARGKIAWGRSEIGGDPIVAVLTEQVADTHLAGLRRDGVSYIFAGARELDLGLSLELLNRELGIERVLLEGGGVANGAFLRAGLVDELSLAIFPAVDGAKGAPSLFDSRDDEAGVPAPLGAVTLASSEVLEGGVVWLRYRLQSSMVVAGSAAVP
jgi:riboflavin biosynthesis pyrimidine reductase